METDQLVRLEALRLALMSNGEDQETAVVVARAEAFAAFLTGSEVTDGDAA